MSYLTQWFDPEPSGPSTWIAQSLVARGATVSIVTGIPNYPTGVPYQGYRAYQKLRETRDEVVVLRCPLYPSHDGSALRRVLNYLTFASSSTLLGQGALKRSDVCLVYCSPQTAAIAAIVSQMLRKTPFVLYVQDLWPDTVLETNMIRSRMVRGIAGHVLRQLDRIATARAAHIVVIAPGMRDALIQRGVPQAKITLAYNWVDEAVIRPHARRGEFRARLGIDAEDLLFVYAGNLGVAQGLETWIRAIKRVNDIERLHFAFIGDGLDKERLRALAEDLEIERLHFLERVGLEQYTQWAADADALIVSLSQSPIFSMTIPGKLQASLALGKAIVSSLHGDAATVISESECGYNAVPGDVESVEAAIRLAVAEGAQGLASLGERGRSYYVRYMSEAVGAQSIMRVLESVTAEGTIS